MTLPDLNQFADPPALYKSAPLWVWNDEMTETVIRTQLLELKEHGFGGAFVHPRPGLITPYLSEEWFELWSIALEEAEKLGLKLYIYDENSYPSGFAGGHVPSELPDCLANSVNMRELDLTDSKSTLPVASGMLNRPGHPIRAFAMKESAEGNGTLEIAQDVTSIPSSEWGQYGDKFLWFEIGKPETNSWLGGFAYTDLMRPEVAQVFLDSTYEAYRSRFGDKFGSSIPAIFTDEPEISPGNLFQAGNNFLPFSYWFAGRFEERNGYDLKDHLPCLFKDVTGPSLRRDARKVRYDYYDTIRELWVENFLQPIYAWCAKHGIAWTGHYLEHNWPYPWGRTSPAVMSLYEYMQWPGIDMLRSNLLRQKDQEGMEPLMLTIREAHSVANQLDKERVLCEAYGAGGWDSDFRDYKRIGDWLVVHGINFINQHLTFVTLSGARKRDHPQSFDWRQPWWEEYGKMNDYFGRLTYMLSQGKTNNRILFLNPVTTVFMESPESQEGGLRLKEAPPQNPDMSLHLKVVQGLCDRQWNYDFGDEFIMERHGHADEGKLQVGSRRYDVVVFPDSMRNMRASTVELLEAYLQSGGRVIAMAEPSSFINGEASEEASKLASYPGWLTASTLDEIDSLLRELLPIDFEWVSETPLPVGVHHLRRDYDDGSSTYFIVNSSPQVILADLKLRGKEVEIRDSWNGNAVAPAYKQEGEFVQLTIELPEEGSLLLVVREEVRSDSDLITSQMGGPNSSDWHGDYTQHNDVQTLSAQTSIQLETENVLVLDYCDIQVGSKSYEGINTVHGQRLIYEHHGFETNPWDNGVQFKRRLLDRNTFAAGTGFTATYRFQADTAGLVGPIQLMVERGRSYELSVNGSPIEWNEASWSLDHHFDAAEISDAIVNGENTITLQVSPFDIRLELEAVYLLGSFTVINAQGKWKIAEPKPLSLGAWKDQGYPFYSNSVVYEKQLHLQATAHSCRVRLSEWGGAVASLHVNGNYAGLFGAGQGESHEVSHLLREGDNSIEVRVSGNLKNMLGPHHEPDGVRKSAWPRNFKKAPLYGPPSAESYDTLAFGLLADFVVEMG
jgi:hypothetical protein